ncbi:MULTISPECIES: hypothetical protein [unclassified Burkholderia]|uniref:hypothetical protein n=1 Tax=unclassified Burkholderia TaxID=2613784 RepID=UPI002AB0656B|nr:MULTISPECIES: hypothetical protein [unclassified Burkholderia]
MFGAVRDEVAAFPDVIVTGAGQALDSPVVVEVNRARNAAHVPISPPISRFPFSGKSAGAKPPIILIIPPAYCVRLIAHIRRAFVRAESD